MTPPLGVIEGYYGRPWSWDMREDQARFLAGHGYRSYIYAPKADAFLRKRWREDHPAAEAERLARMAAACAVIGVGFGVGLSPYEAWRDFGEDTKAALARKLAFFDAAGVTELAILFDDMKGDQADLAEAQVRMADFAAEHSNARRLIVCPTVYCDDPTLQRLFGPWPDNYLEDLGRLLDPGIEVFWTGEEVCSREYSPGHLARVGEQLRRRPTLWDNYPVNDGPGMSPFLYLRAFTGRPAAIGPHLAAHMVNPSLQPTLFRIPALTLAESYAAGDAYAYGAAWERAAREVLGEDLAGLLARHFRLFHDQGLGRIDDETAAKLRARYAAIDHPAAREVVAWLDGFWRVTREEMEAA
ncbi:MAG TPA: beta-N-acetylglucosaminidase domain-containing protein [Caulobacteraceae bacterium]|nr:beta-N-acetylglucosaminidase domain-containing protein [Caulobacteraceae bacterium]